MLDIEENLPQVNEENPAPASPPLSSPGTPAFDPRRRIRELLSIPDRDRSDAEWDELNELEIQTAPGNRATGQPFTTYGGPGNKPGGGGGAPVSKNRFKGKQRKPGSGPRPPQQQAKPNTKPRPPG